MKAGTVGWIDLTTGDAPTLKTFYERVVGWSSEPVAMDGYDDWVMKPPDGDGVAGICHARGGNEGIPPQWMIYVIVTDLDHAIAECRQLGGSVVHGPQAMGDARYCIIRDPAGAHCALYQP